MDKFLNGTSTFKLSSLLIWTYHTNEYPQVRDQRLEIGQASDPPNAVTSSIGRFSCSDIYECKCSENLFDNNWSGKGRMEIKVCLNPFLTRCLPVIHIYSKQSRKESNSSSTGLAPEHSTIPRSSKGCVYCFYLSSYSLIWFVLAVDLRECSLAISDLPGYTSDNVSIFSVPGILSNTQSPR